MPRDTECSSVQKATPGTGRQKQDANITGEATDDNSRGSDDRCDHEDSPENAEAALIQKGPGLLGNMWDKTCRTGLGEVVRVINNTISILRARGDQKVQDLNLIWQGKVTSHLDDQLRRLPRLAGLMSPSHDLDSNRRLGKPIQGGKIGPSASPRLALPSPSPSASRTRRTGLGLQLRRIVHLERPGTSSREARLDYFL
jgi:hypothetical protein